MPRKVKQASVLRGYNLAVFYKDGRFEIITAEYLEFIIDWLLENWDDINFVREC